MSPSSMHLAAHQPGCLGSCQAASACLASLLMVAFWSALLRSGRQMRMVPLKISQLSSTADKNWAVSMQVTTAVASAQAHSIQYVYIIGQKAWSIRRCFAAKDLLHVCDAKADRRCGLTAQFQTSSVAVPGQLSVLHWCPV